MKRSGFTLIELLVVIAIIAVLAGTLILAVRGYLGSARKAGTTSLILRIDRAVSARAEGVRATQPNNSDLASTISAAQQIYGVTLSREQARVVWAKETWIRNLPETFAELTTPRPLLAGRGRPMYSGPTPPTTDPPSVYERAAVLYYVVTQGDSLGAIGSIPDQDFLASEVSRGSADWPHADWPYFVDRWGNPISFYRWPTWISRPPNGQVSDLNLIMIYGHRFSDDHLNRDPDDPVGLGSQIPWFVSAYHEPDTLSAPIVISGGPADGWTDDTDLFGLRGRRAEVVNPTHLQRVITNRNSAAAGR